VSANIAILKMAVSDSPCEDEVKWNPQIVRQQRKVRYNVFKIHKWQEVVLHIDHRSAYHLHDIVSIRILQC
jgi:hypothetical protein